MSLSIIHKNIEKHNFSSVYLLLGTETFLIEETKQKILEYALTEEEYDFNLSIFDMEETPIEVALEDAETLPFLGDRRVVILKKPVFLTGQKDKASVEHDLKRLETYLEDPPPFTILIFIAPYEKLDERKKVVKLLKKQAQLVEAKEMNYEMLMGWLKNRAHELEVEITNSAIERLVALIGPRLMMLSQEINKMGLHVGKNGTIDEIIVSNLVSRSVEQNVFDLSDKVVHRKIDEALRIYYDLLQVNEEPIKIAALLAQQFRLIYQVNVLTKQGHGQMQIAGQLKVHPYRVKLAAGYNHIFDDHELKAILDQLAEADYHMKTGRMDKALALELFLMKLNKVQK